MFSKRRHRSSPSTAGRRDQIGEVESACRRRRRRPTNTRNRLAPDHDKLRNRFVPNERPLALNLQSSVSLAAAGDNQRAAPYDRVDCRRRRRRGGERRSLELFCAPKQTRANRQVISLFIYGSDSPPPPPPQAQSSVSRSQPSTGRRKEDTIIAHPSIRTKQTTTRNQDISRFYCAPQALLLFILISTTTTTATTLSHSLESRLVGAIKSSSEWPSQHQDGPHNPTPLSNQAHTNQLQLYQQNNLAPSWPAGLAGLAQDDTSWASNRLVAIKTSREPLQPDLLKFSQENLTPSPSEQDLTRTYLVNFQLGSSAPFDSLLIGLPATGEHNFLPIIDRSVGAAATRTADRFSYNTTTTTAGNQVDQRRHNDADRGQPSSAVVMLTTMGDGGGGGQRELDRTGRKQQPSALDPSPKRRDGDDDDDDDAQVTTRNLADGRHGRRPARADKLQQQQQRQARSRRHYANHERPRRRRHRIDRADRMAELAPKTNGQQLVVVAVGGGRPRPASEQTTATTFATSNTITAHRMHESGNNLDSFKQADNSQQSQPRRAQPSKPPRRRQSGDAATIATSESQWIPIVTNSTNASRMASANRRNNRVGRLNNNQPAAETPSPTLAGTGAALNHGHGLTTTIVTQAASGQQQAAAASALLDYPARPQAANQADKQQQQFRQRPPLTQGRQRAVDGHDQRPRAAAAAPSINQLTAADSQPHGRRHPHPLAAHETRHHRYHDHHDHQHHHRHVHDDRHLWHQVPGPGESYGRRGQKARRPRFNEPTSAYAPQHTNTIETGAYDSLMPYEPFQRPTKLYKRVLLCDKTLVSLDYVRHLGAEPRPMPAAAAAMNQLLNEHELNEISDNFIPSSDLDGAYEVMAARRSEPQRSTAAESAGQPAQPSPHSVPLNLSLNATSSSGTPDELAANDELRANSSLAPAAAASMNLEQRYGSPAANPLLSDDDPLVRCDMWDLEKGIKSRKPPEAILRMAMKADFDTVRDAINRCRQLSERTLPTMDDSSGGGGGIGLASGPGVGETTLEIMSTEDLVSLFSMKRGLIPGTKWCGLGDQANSYNDLGPKHRIDICCRAHDHCPIRSKPFRNDYGVLNIGLYTKSHCDCDADFYRCLREVRSRTADMLGNLYFNVMKLQCMREERLKVCRELKPIALGFERCVRYEESPVKTVFKFTTPPVSY